MANTPIEISFRIFDGKVYLKWAGNNAPVTVYRTSIIQGNYQEKTDWTAEETLGAMVTTGELVDDSPLEYNVYYVTDGTFWNRSERFSLADYAPVIQPDYETVSLDRISWKDAYRNALNKVGASKFTPITVPPGDIAIIAVTGTEEIADRVAAEYNFGEALAELDGITGFAILQTGTFENFTGYDAKLSGSVQVKYTA
jgi:hypothetical protein